MSAGLMANRLTTYADRPQVARVLQWKREFPSGRVLMDSGAFSAFTKGTAIDLGRYCEFVTENAALITAYAALDVIGDPDATRANTDAMVARGLRPIPTYHRGSPWKFLESMAVEFDYIALGGMATSSARGLRATRETVGPYLDGCFSLLERYWPVRVHLFGSAQPWVLERYPVYSADTSSAVRGAGMGVVQASRGDGTLAWLNWRDDLAVSWNGEIADGVSENSFAGRWAHNLRVQASVERYATDLWVSKGVKWSS